MHFTRILSILALAVMGASAVQQPQKQFLISFPQDTPQSELDDYKSAISSAGGEILHEWELIKGFIIKASTEALNSIEAFSEQHIGSGGVKATIEEDEKVKIQN